MTHLTHTCVHIDCHVPVSWRVSVGAMLFAFRNSVTRSCFRHTSAWTSIFIHKIVVLVLVTSVSRLHKFGHWMIGEHGESCGMKICSCNRSTWRKTLPQFHFVNTNPKWYDLESNTDSRDGKQAANYYSTALIKNSVHTDIHSIRTCIRVWYIFFELVYNITSCSVLKNKLNVNFNLFVVPNVGMNI